MTTTTATITPQTTGTSGWGRRRALAGCGALLAAGTVVLAAGPAQAQVNTQGAPTHTYTLTGTNCSALVGAVKTTTGAVMAGVDVTCGSVHLITSRAVEWRWNGSTWQSWSSSNFTARTTYLSVHGAGICGGGAAQWYTAAYVSIDGASYGPLNSNSTTSAYTPPNC